jgi:hypothetical protein
MENTNFQRSRKAFDNGLWQFWVIFKAGVALNVEYRTPNDEVEEWSLPVGR